MVKRKNIPVPQILVQWAQLGEEEATWEDYDEIRKQFPGISLEDKTHFQGEGMSEPVSVQLLAPAQVLVTVGDPLSSNGGLQAINKEIGKAQLRMAQQTSPTDSPTVLTVCEILSITGALP